MDTHTFSPTALSNRTILVTGASSGIGLEVAIRLSSIGARLLVTGRDSTRLAKTMELLRPGNHEYLKADLTTPGGLEEMRLFIENQENLHGFVHAAGSQIVKPFRSSEPSDYRNMYEIHVVAAAEIMRRIVNKIGRDKGGSIVFLSSVASLRASAGIGAYAAAKAAVISLTKSSALELGGLGIRVNCLVPGMVSSPMSEKLISRLPAASGESLRVEHPLGIGTPVNIADAVTFLLSDASIWITGSAIPVDGGFLVY